MGLGEFIDSNIPRFAAAWAAESRFRANASGFPSANDFIQHASAVLRSIADAVTQGAAAPTGTIVDTARAYVAAQLAAGALLTDVMADYHALRRMVTDRWRSLQENAVGTNGIDELIVFDRALDASLAEACRWYMERIEDARELLNGVLAHDLRTPLSAIMSCADLLMLDKALDITQTATAARIRFSGMRMQRMINDVLDFTRTRLRNKLPMALSWGDLGQLVRQIAAELSSFNVDARVRCVTQGDLSLRCDPARIEQMTSNLLSNAIEHATPGTPITVEAWGDADELRISVHNFGQVIPAAEQVVIFYPLMRAAIRRSSDAADRSGLGLGLYIARQIVEAHGGTIDVTSVPRDGTTFVVRLPRHTTS